MLTLSSIRRLKRCTLALGTLVAAVATSVQAEQPTTHNFSDTAVIQTGYTGGKSSKPADSEYNEGGSAPTYSDGGSYDSGDSYGDFGSGLASAGSSSGAGMMGGYIDPARIGTRVRLRYDNMMGANAATRAEMFYPTLTDLGGPGPNGIILAGDIDIQEFAPYVEIQLTDRMSIFGEFPVRAVPLLDTTGFGDIRTGVRYALIDDCDRALTAQLRIYVPTGNANEALGVGHVSIEPGLLYQREMNNRLTLFGEIHDWINVSDDVIANGTPGTFDGQSLSSNVLRYGVGVGYDLWQDSCGERKLTGVVEFVGWTVLDGLITPLDPADAIIDATGDTIINGKYGVRYSCGRNTVYAGYGHNLSSDRWYSDLLRIEVSRAF